MRTGTASGTHNRQTVARARPAPSSATARCPPLAIAASYYNGPQAARRDAEVELKAARHAQKHHEIGWPRSRRLWGTRAVDGERERRQFRKEFEQKMKAEVEEERTSGVCPAQ